MVSENEHSSKHELLRHRLFDIEQQTWISEIHNNNNNNEYLYRIALQCKSTVIKGALTNEMTHIKKKTKNFQKI